MLLADLVKGLENITVKGKMNTEIISVDHDSRKVQPGSLFVCVPGFISDGRKYAKEAVKRGAEALLMEDTGSEYILPYVNDEGFETESKTVPVICCENVRRTMAFCADRLYGHPSKEMELIGITGTKGKTTTSYMLRGIFLEDGRKTGMIGTISNIIGDKEIPAQRTTPESTELQKMLREMADIDTKTCVTEVSSQGLNLDRVAYCDYSVGIFTNLTPDHIGPGEHTDMEDYARAKSKLFAMAKDCVINNDSPYKDIMINSAKEAEANIYTYGIDSECNFRGENIIFNKDSVQFDVRIQIGDKAEYHTILVDIPGRFTVYNSLAAMAAAYIRGVSPENIKKALEKIYVPGKAEIIPVDKEYTVMIDYAHNPDSIQNIIRAAREFSSRVILLFGCGGDRNRPRALMGEIAGRNADYTIITSDNPRSEDPESIIKDIEKGIKNTSGEYICITDRKQAISYGLKMARKGDCLILAGKGHEKYQIFKDKTIEFDEKKIVEELLSGQ